MKKQVFCAALTAVFFFTSGCALLPKEEELPAPPMVSTDTEQGYTMATVSYGDLEISKRVRASYRPTGSETIRFPLGGVAIDTLYVKKGDTVKAGDLLLSLEMGTLLSDIENANQDLRQAELNLQALEENYALDLKEIDLKIQAAEGESKQALESEKTVLTQNYQRQREIYENDQYIASLSLNELNAQRESRLVYAGIDGTVSTITALKEGDLTTKGDIFVILSDLSSSVFLVEGEDSVYFPVGTEVVLEAGSQEYAAVSMESDQDETAYLSLIDPALDLEEGDVGQVTVVFDSREHVLTVPSQAVRMAGDQPVVYQLDEEGIKYLTEIETGLDTGVLVEVVSGLEEGDEVIVE